MKNFVTFESNSDSTGESTRNYNIESDDPSVVSIAEDHDRNQRELDYEFQKRKEWDGIKTSGVLVAIIIVIGIFMAIVS